jgi:hypothetical protein
VGGQMGVLVAGLNENKANSAEARTGAWLSLAIYLRLVCCVIVVNIQTLDFQYTLVFHQSDPNMKRYFSKNTFNSRNIFNIPFFLFY